MSNPKGSTNARAKVASAPKKPGTTNVRAARAARKPSVQPSRKATISRAKPVAPAKSVTRVRARDLSAVRQSRGSVNARSVARPNRAAQPVRKQDNQRLVVLTAYVMAALAITLVDKRVGLGFALGIPVWYVSHAVK